MAGYFSVISGQENPGFPNSLLPSIPTELGLRCVRFRIEILFKSPDIIRSDKVVTAPHRPRSPSAKKDEVFGLYANDTVTSLQSGNSIGIGRFTWQELSGRNNIRY